MDQKEQDGKARFHFAKRRKIALLGIMALVLAAMPIVSAMLQVTITNVGTVVGQTKELTISIQAAVTLLGAVTVMPACATQLASSFADTATASLNWGATLQSNTDYETFFCIGNIGASAGVIHATVTASDGSTVAIEQCNSGILGITFSALDGATISGSGVIAAHVRLHTPTVALNGSTSLNSKISFTLS